MRVDRTTTVEITIIKVCGKTVIKITILLRKGLINAYKTTAGLFIQHVNFFQNESKY